MAVVTSPQVGVSAAGGTLRPLFRALLIGGVLVALYLLITRYPIAAGRSLELSTAQFLIFPFIILGLLALRRRCSSISLGLIMMALFGGLFSALHTFHISVKSTSGFALARLDNDQFEADSRIVRSRIAQHLQGRHVAINRIPQQINDITEARAVALDRNDGQPILWGSDRWFRIFVPDEAGALISERVARRVAEDYGMRVLTSYPHSGLPSEPHYASAQFIAYLMSGLVTRSAEVRESSLRTAALLRSSWRTYTHKAFAAFQLGNFYLNQAFDGDALQLGELRCARTAYEKAYTYLKSAEDPELAAAILNNHAVVLRILAWEEAGQGKVKQARRELRAAIAMHRVAPRYEGTFRAVELAMENIVMTKSRKNVAAPPKRKEVRAAKAKKGSQKLRRRNAQR